MKVCFLGSRLQELGGFNDCETHKKIKEKITEELKRLKDEGKKPTVITGLQIGVETWAAEIAHKLDIPYSVYVPFDNPQSKWPSAIQHHYKVLLKNATSKKQLDTGTFDVKKLFNKEIKMIDDSEIVFTAFVLPLKICQYIEKAGKTIIEILPKETSDEFSIPF